MYSHIAQGIVDDARRWADDLSLGVNEMMALARLLTCIYMNSYIEGGSLCEDSTFEAQIRNLAARLRGYEQAAPAIADMARTGLVDATPASPVTEEPAPSTLDDCRTAAELLAYYHRRVIATCTPPTATLTEAILSRAAAIPAPTLADRLTLAYITYSAIAEYEELGF